MKDSTSQNIRESGQKLVVRIATVFCCLFLQGCVTYTYPWKDSEAMRRDLLKVTPLGSGLSEVEQKLKARHLEVSKSMNTGFLRWVNGQSELVGEKSVRTHLGGYRSGLLVETTITAYWAFDKQEKLIEIWVRKENDSL